jgi:DNA-binding response OmpR family regulator
MNILIIEDDCNAVDFVRFAFMVGWPEVKLSIAYKGLKGLDIIKKQKIDMVLLDLGLPDLSGFDVLQKIRDYSEVPIIVITAMDFESDIVKALELGANEYVIKPFGQMEIVARAKALFKVYLSVKKDSQNLVIGPWHFNPQKQMLFNNDFEVRLTPTENAVLFHLFTNIGNVVTYTSIAEAVWGTDYAGSAGSIRVYISRLRQKMEKDPGYPSMILSKMGIGYYLTKDTR